MLHERFFLKFLQSDLSGRCELKKKDLYEPDFSSNQPKQFILFVTPLFLNGNILYCQ